MVTEMSKTYQYRKVMKPLLERKRRARINKCLDDLKDLMVECLQQEGEHVTRLEKADILELTVEHMRKLKQRGSLSLQSQSTAHVESFRSGYVHAADQISQVLLQQRQTDEIGGKIMKFLSTRLMDMQHQLLRASSNSSPSASMPPASVCYASPPPPSALHASTATHAVAAGLLNTAAGCSNPLLYRSATNSASFRQQHTETDYKLFYAREGHSDLIDVTTVDHSMTDSSSVISVDSNSSDSVWRPW